MTITKDFIYEITHDAYRLKEFNQRYSQDLDFREPLWDTLKVFINTSWAMLNPNGSQLIRIVPGPAISIPKPKEALNIYLRFKVYLEEYDRGDVLFYKDPIEAGFITDFDDISSLELLIDIIKYAEEGIQERFGYEKVRDWDLEITINEDIIHPYNAVRKFHENKMQRELNINKEAFNEAMKRLSDPIPPFYKKRQNPYKK